MDNKGYFLSKWPNAEPEVCFDSGCQNCSKPIEHTCSLHFLPQSKSSDSLCGVSGDSIHLIKIQARRKGK